jgi:hypothetical protein
MEMFVRLLQVIWANVFLWHFYFATLLPPSNVNVARLTPLECHRIVLLFCSGYKITELMCSLNIMVSGLCLSTAFPVSLMFHAVEPY